MKSVSKFLSLKSAGDILNVVAPLNNSVKEISESMAMIKHLRGIALKNKMEYTLLDLCAGNALTSIISIYLLPFNKAIAVDRNPRHRKTRFVHRFEYKKLNILEENPIELIKDEKSVVITTTHACCELAIKTIDIYKELKNNNINTRLVLMPCCIGEFKYNTFVKKLLGKYLAWSLYLTEKVDGELYIEKDCLSPCNAVIVA